MEFEVAVKDFEGSTENPPPGPAWYRPLTGQHNCRQTQVYERESAELAAELVLDICLRHGIAPGQLIVHSDNGSPMKGETMLATLQRLGVLEEMGRD